jgi:hypothetical protein
VANKVVKKKKAKDSDEEISEDEGFDENGKPIFKDETFKVKPDEIIAKNEKSKKTLKELEKVYGEDPDVKKARLESNKVVLE